jgi:uncharacterized protein YnzC (UPF0291/DUF896 family)
VVIPLSNKDADDLQRWNNEQEDQRRRTSIQGKSKPPRVPSLGALDRMMRERPLGAGLSKAQTRMGKVPEAVVRVQDARTGEWVDRPVLRGETPKSGVVNSIKFIEGNVYVNGDFAPELTNTLKSVIKGTVQLPTGVVPRQVYGQPIMIGQQPQQVPSLAADGVRVTDSLVRTYISQLEKQSGQKGTLLPTKIQYGPELYDRLFGTQQTTENFVKVEGGNKGKGTPMGDAKDIQMRKIANAAIVELADAEAQSKITARVPGAVGKTSSETSLLQLGPASTDLAGKTIMLARNGKLSNQPLRPETIAQITQAARAGANFVVGDMPGVDSEFIKLLNSLNAPYKIYHTGNEPRITTESSTKREPKVINVRKLSKNLSEDQKFTKTDLPKNAVYVGRNYTKGKYQLQGTPWGNPYRVGPDGNLDQVLEKYEGWARTQLSKNPNWLQPLIGKDLVDWCEPGKCHADVLKKLIKEQVGEFERTPLTGKSQLSDIDEMRERFNELDAKKKRGGTERLTKGEANEYNRLKEMIRKAITVDPEAAEMPEESPTKVKVSDPEKFQQMRKRFNELDAIMKTKGLAGAELAEYQRLDQEIKSIRTESTQRVDGTSDKPGEIVSAKKTPEVKVTVKSIGDSKAPGIYADGKYAPQVTYAVVQAMVKAKENKAFWQTLSRQGGIRVGKVFVSVEDMQRLAKAIPADTEVVYNKQGKPVVKPRTTSGGAFGIAGKTLNTLGIVGAIGDILRLSKEWSETGKRKVPIS